MTNLPAKRSLLTTLANRYQLEPKKLLETLKATVFENKATEAEMIAFLTVAANYDLDPFRQEIYAFRKQGGGIQPLVGIDGWLSVINRVPMLDGMEIGQPVIDDSDMSITVKIHRKDRGHPTVVTEYYSECRRNTAPWNTMPKRMLRHRAIAQAARVAFGISGIMLPEEAEEMLEAEVTVKGPPTTLEQATEVLQQEPVVEQEEYIYEVAEEAHDNDKSAPEPEPTDPVDAIPEPESRAEVELFPDPEPPRKRRAPEGLDYRTKFGKRVKRIQDAVGEMGDKKFLFLNRMGVKDLTKIDEGIARRLENELGLPVAD